MRLRLVGLLLLTPTQRSQPRGCNTKKKFLVSLCARGWNSNTERSQTRASNDTIGLVVKHCCQLPSL